jgi:hypothetical protein
MDTTGEGGKGTDLFALLHEEGSVRIEHRAIRSPPEDDKSETEERVDRLVLIEVRNDVRHPHIAATRNGVGNLFYSSSTGADLILHCPSLREHHLPHGADRVRCESQSLEHDCVNEREGGLVENVRGDRCINLVISSREK